MLFPFRNWGQLWLSVAYFRFGVYDHRNKILRMQMHKVGVTPIKHGLEQHGHRIFSYLLILCHHYQIFFVVFVFLGVIKSPLNDCDYDLNMIRDSEFSRFRFRFCFVFQCLRIRIEQIL